MLSINRIDNDVCGLLLAADNIHVQKQYIQIIKNRKTTKMYIGEIFGKLQNNITKITECINYNKNNIKSNICKNGETATTYVYKISEKKYESLNNQIVTKVAFVIITGKTHQIRLHMKHFGKPILCDKIYGLKNNIYQKISSEYNSIALKSLLYIFHFEKYNIGYF